MPFLSCLLVKIAKIKPREIKYQETKKVLVLPEREKPGIEVGLVLNTTRTTIKPRQKKKNEFASF